MILQDTYEVKKADIIPVEVSVRRALQTGHF